MADNIAVYTFSNIDLVHQCLLDTDRLSVYQTGIRKAINAGATSVLDVGTGSGVLAAMAAKLGVEYVAAVEIDPYLNKVASSVFKANNLSEKVDLISIDVRNLACSDLRRCPIDLVTMDLLTTGLIDEYQVQAINALHSAKIVTSQTVFVPCKQITFISLCNIDFQAYGLKFPIVRHIWKQFDSLNPSYSLMSDRYLLNEVMYNNVTPIDFKKQVEIEAVSSGIVNSVYLNSETWIDQESFIQDTESLNAPVVFPIEPFEIKRGEKATLTVAYKFGEGFSSMKVQKD